MSLVADDVLRWIKFQVADLTEKGPITRVEVWHSIEGEGAERCQVFGVEQGASVDELAQMVWDTAEHDASTRTPGVTQRYSVAAYRGENIEHEGQHPFNIRGHGTGGLMLGQDTESPTERGQTAHMMRHDGDMHRMMMLMANSTAGALATELDRERKRRELVEDRMLDVTRLYQEVLDKKQERELEAAREATKARRQDELMGMVMSMMPLMLSKLLGGGAEGGMGAVLRDQAIGKFLKSLSREEGEALLSSLSGPHRMAFLEFYTSYSKEDAKDQAKKPIILRDPPEPQGTQH